MAGLSSVSPPQERTLPPLRKNLQFLRGAPTPEGVPTWTIVDPVRNKYFQIEWQVYQILQRWSCGTVEKLVAVVRRDTTSRIRAEDVEDLVRFLYANSLTEQSASGRVKDYVEQEAARHHVWWQWLLHHYLFIKIPLVRPHGFLQATLPLVAPLYTPLAAWCFGIAGAIGLFLVGQQWSTFLSTFLHFFTWSGALMYGAVFCAVKVVHELGHAYTATRFGCRVPTIGVALMVMMPVLYSDISDAYRLSSRRKRLWIAGAGVVAELGLAAVATLVWGFLPDGAIRSVVFVAATTSWVMSLAVNLNPFMRFDGYYLLADGLGIPNLQDRAFAFGQWRIRELLFAPGAPPPEAVGLSNRRILIAYAWGIWLYRLVLFTGIALAVYHYFFKVLGLLLFLVEIVFFIGLPIWRELTSWWSRRAAYASTGRFAVTMTVVAAMLLLACLPWSSRVAIPGVLQAGSYATIYPPAPGRIASVSVHAGQSVRAGDTVLVLENPLLAKEARLARTQVELLDFRLQRQAGYAEDRLQGQVLAESLRSKLVELDGVAEKQQRLVLQAPIDGVVVDQADSLYPGRWINEKLAVAYVVNSRTAIVTALAPVEDLGVLAVGQEALFIPNDVTRQTTRARVTEIRDVDEQDLSVPYLASIYGGAVPVRKDSHGRLQAEQSVYRVELEVLDEVVRADQVVTGLIHVAGTPQSLVARMWDRVVAVMIRESGL
ncbi:MAG: HlyD family efflux transporter periplasmic adaptor subunit [Nitrospira sp.]|jgi:putative peptide zinc metalloprotease protein|nr:HlyD family efflux transporter periplasmic adaptor subunit [Nitrospira sp.]MBP6207677.1 HlyD family efflux transporter periplasmic adaptor subunit [Nitrospira sp.]MBP8105614.1 HlyD family efflux transporter periplasmic adaptor subunit [Nitrospira sp.]MBP8827276.1 HlyD family efflux transporter periplasmic adaptor subunit [Nitrospira sp.]HRC25635.1 HlyD family efflux transporter periplasmic adaptor subunit [Nitrospira sp.]